jgi:hypothetical protein
MSELAFDAVFEACCLRLEQGAELEDVLASYPELSHYPQEAAELREALETVAQVTTLRQQPPPAPRLQGEIREQFLAEIARLPAPAPLKTTLPPRPNPTPTAKPQQPAPRPWRQRLQDAFFAARPLSPAWASALITLAIATFILATLSVAEAAWPGDELYGLKIVGKQVEQAVQLTLYPGNANEINRSFNEARVREAQKALALGRSAPIQISGMILAVYPRDYAIIVDPGLAVDVPPELWNEALARNVYVLIEGVTNPERDRAYATYLEIPERAPKYSLPPQTPPALPPTPTRAAGRTPRPRPTLKPTATRRPPTWTPRPTNTPPATSTPTMLPSATATSTVEWTPTPSSVPVELTPTSTPTAPEATATETPIAAPVTPTATIAETPTPAEVTPTPTVEEITATPTVVEPTPTPTAEAITVTPTDTPLPPTETSAPPTETPIPTATLAAEPTVEPTGVSWHETHRQLPALFLSRFALRFVRLAYDQ